MKIRLLRHATLLLEYSGQRFLVDPMLSPAGEMPPVENTPNQKHNPLVELPMPAEKVSDGVEAVLVTHTHSDHWDAAAAKVLPRQLPFFVQPEDAAKIGDQGFHNLQVMPGNIRRVFRTPQGEEDSGTFHGMLSWRGIGLFRTGGEHGKGSIGRKMGPVSGFILRAPGEKVLYIAGDTVWCDAVSDTLNAYSPEVIVLNAGAAQFLQGKPITMAGDDVVDVCQAAPGAKVVAVHMEAFNHCLLTRQQLRESLKDIHVNEQVHIPADGETLEF